MNGIGNLRIIVSSVSSTHPLDLARQLASRSLLQTYYTTVLASRTVGVPPESARRHLALGLGIYAVNRGWILGDKVKRQHLCGYELHRWIAAHLEATDVAHALPGCGLQMRRLAKHRFGALTVCDSGTSHERFQSDLLKDEVARWDADRPQISEKHLRYVESEYEEVEVIMTPSAFARGTASLPWVPVPRKWRSRHTAAVSVAL